MTSTGVVFDASDVENPFDDTDMPVRPPRQPIGVCVDCGEPAFTLMDESFGRKHAPLMVCYPDAYHRAN